MIGVSAFLLAYRFYAKHLGRRVWEVETDAETPAQKFEDGVDFVPTRKSVLFGHHFASIAGLAPVLGPAIAVIWGWLPALVWIVLGTILLGAVHDFSALALSLKHEGRSIGDLTGSILGGRGRVLFLIVVFFLLALAMGVFALIVGQLFATTYPETVIPVFSLMVIAAAMGYCIYKLRLSIIAATVVALGLMFFFIWVGINHPVSAYKLFLSDEVKGEIAAGLESAELASDAKPPAVAAYLRSAGRAETAQAVNAAAASATSMWVLVLLGYALVASVLPVWLLLQPRDYLNSYQLFIGVGGLLLGALILHPKIVAPAVNPVGGLPAIFPILFITVACGAISGFHSVVSSGTTARQLRATTDARPIAYGGMLMEGLLALIVVLACSAGMGAEKWGGFYESWKGLTGTLAATLAPFFHGAGTFLGVFGIPRIYGEAIAAVVLVGFAMTTLDSGTRLLRYNIEELADTVKLKRFFNRYLAGLLAVVVLAAVAFLKVPVKTPGGGVVPRPAGIMLWQLFGTTNQMLACLGLLVATVFLIKKRKPSLYTAIPFAFMLVMTVWAMLINVAKAYSRAKPELRSWPLLVVGTVLIVVTGWLAAEAVATVVRAKRRPAAEAAGGPAVTGEAADPPDA